MSRVATSQEHKVAELMFQQQDYVCMLKTAMRYQGDPVLSRILLKMRTVNEDRTHLQLMAEEWQVLQSTDIHHGSSLKGTAPRYHAAFSWSQVCMAQWTAQQILQLTSMRHCFWSTPRTTSRMPPVGICVLPATPYFTSPT